MLCKPARASHLILRILQVVVLHTMMVPINLPWITAIKDTNKKHIELGSGLTKEQKEKKYAAPSFRSWNQFVAMVIKHLPDGEARASIMLYVDAVKMKGCTATWRKSKW
jgi:hypothetical protein